MGQSTSSHGKSLSPPTCSPNKSLQGCFLWNWAQTLAKLSNRRCRLNPKRPNVFVVVLGCFVCFSAGTQTQDLVPGRQALHLFVPSETTWFGNEESPSCPLSVENRNRPGPFLAQATTVKYFCYHLFFEKGSPVTMTSWSSCLHLPNTGIQLNQSSY